MYNRTRAEIVAAIQADFERWEMLEELRFLSPSGASEEERETIREADVLRKLALAESVFSFMPDMIYQAVRSGYKYNGACVCAKPAPGQVYCAECYGGIEDAGVEDEGVAADSQPSAAGA